MLLNGHLLPPLRRRFAAVRPRLHLHGSLACFSPRQRRHIWAGSSRDQLLSVATLQLSPDVAEAPRLESLLEEVRHLVQLEAEQAELEAQK